MSLITLSIGFVVAIAFGVMYFLWSNVCTTSRMPRGGSYGWISYVFIALYFLSLLSFTARESSGGGSDGLSSRNAMQVVVVLCITAWVTYLLLTRRLNWRVFVGGSGYWILIQSMIFAATIAWSVAPALTAYRAVELLVCWLVTAHAVTCAASWIDGVEMIFVVLFFETLLIPRLLFSGSGLSWTLSGSNNVGSFVGVTLLIILVHKIIFSIRKVRAAEWLLTPLVLLCISSLGSAVAFVFGMAGVFYFRLPRRLRTWCGAVGVVSFIAVVIVLFGNAAAVQRLAVSVAESFGRDTRNVSNLTGRLPLWTAIWNYSKDLPFGSGYVAGERLFVTTMVSKSEVSWGAIHSHNGFISAWMTAGWLGLSCVVCLLASIWRHVKVASSSIREVSMGLFVVAIVNNLVFPVTGYAFSPGWVLIFALSYLPAAVRGAIRESGRVASGEVVWQTGANKFNSPLAPVGAGVRTR